MADIVAVEAAGPGWTRVRTSDGQSVTLKGTRNWRNNNPGNIEYGSFARSMGAIGTDGRFAVFPSYDAGRQAKASLLFDNPRYNTKTVAGAIKRYAPPTENNTNRYIRSVTNALGITRDTPISSLNRDQQARMLDTMQSVEGYRVGRAYDAQGNLVDPSALQSNQTGGIMAAINGGVPVPTARPMTQAQSTTGIMAAVNPLTRGAVQSAGLPPVASAYATIQDPREKLRQDLQAQKAALENQRVGSINPFAAQEQPKKYSLAEQYGLYGQGQAAARNMGLLAQDVASMPSQTYPVANAPQTQPQTTQPVALPEVQQPQPVSYASPAVQRGLLSPQEQLAIDAQADFLAGQPVNRRSQIGAALKKGASAFGGGVLGGLLLGPIGAVAGGLLGPTLVNGMTGASNFPAAPDSKPKGNGKMTEYGDRVRNESKQFDRAVRSGRGGLW